ncbi:MAG: adenylate/guanylate cyclase domain-containing protein [Spirulinaceae cyanobacterium]
MNQNYSEVAKANILVIEETLSDLQLLVSILTGRGHLVKSLRDGRDVFLSFLVEKQKPDLILLNPIMLIGDGYEICQQLQSNQQTSQIPLVLILSGENHHHREKVFAAGAVDYLLKPLQEQEIISRVENQLQLHSLQEKLSQQGTRLQKEIRLNDASEAISQLREAKLYHQSQTLANFSANLKSIHRLNTTSYSNFEKLFADYLETGCKILGSSTGIISRVQGQTYTIYAVKSPLKSLVADQQFSLQDTYCVEVIKQQQTVTYYYGGAIAPVKINPTYGNLKLECYLGTPIWVNGEIYGTLNFSSHQVRPHKFTPQEQEIIELMAQSLGKLVTSHQIEIRRKRAELALRESERKLRKQNSVLSKLAQNPALYQGDLALTLEIITETIADTLEVERVSVWLYDKSGTKLQCQDAFQRNTQQHHRKEDLLAANYPNYFKVLESQWNIAADDVLTNPYTQEFAAYFAETNIVSTLDTSIRLMGQTVGVLCLEQVDYLRAWTADEQNFANSITDLISLTLEATETRRTQEAQRLSEEKFSLAFYSNPDPMAIVTLVGGEYLDVNESFLRSLSYCREEVIGLSPGELNIWVEPHERTRIMQTLQQEGAVSKQEVNWQTKLGQTRTVLFSAELIYLEGQECLLSVVNDITERKQAEKALLELFGLAALDADVGVALTKGKTLGEMLNLCAGAIHKHLDAAFARIWILNEGENLLELKASAGMYTHLDGSHSCIPVGSYKIGRIAQRRTPYLTNDVVNDPQISDPQWAKETGMVAFAGYPLTFENKLLGVIAVFAHHPLTEATLLAMDSIANNIALGIDRFRAEESLSRSNALLTSQQEAALDGILVVDEKQNITSYNQHFCQLWQVPEELFAGSSDHQVFAWIFPQLENPQGFTEKVEYLHNHPQEICQEEIICRNGCIFDFYSASIQSQAGEYYGRIWYFRDITARKRSELALRVAQQKSESLLLNILPQAIVKQLENYEGSIAEQFDEATILFADIVNFTDIGASVSPLELVDLLNDIFSTFDELVDYHGLEKIKTIGDAYMVAGGLPIPRARHLEAIADLALDMQQAIDRFHNSQGETFQIRIGIHTGSVVAGVIGIKKFTYDLWGDTVNVASRMESQGEAGSIQVTTAIYEKLRHKYVFAKRGTLLVKGKGEMCTYWLIDRKQE